MLEVTSFQCQKVPNQTYIKFKRQQPFQKRSRVLNTYGKTLLRALYEIGEILVLVTSIFSFSSNSFSVYCERRNFRWALILVDFVGKDIHEFKFTSYLKTNDGVTAIFNLSSSNAFNLD